MDFEKVLQENHGKEVTIYTKDNHHYQGQLVGCQCKYNHYECSHLIMLLMGVNYIDIPVDAITEVKLAESDEVADPLYPRFISG